MDVRGLVYGLVNYFPGPLRGPARRVADAVFGAWDDVSNVFRIVRPSWSRIWVGINGFVWQVAQGFINTWQAAWWIAFDWLPRFVGTAVDNLGAWARARLDALLDTVQRGLSYVLGLAQSLVNGVIAELRAVRDWLWDHILRTVATLNAVARLVNMFLTDPRVLVQWILSALINALLQWVDSNLERLAEALWARRMSIVLRSVERIEQIIARLL